MAQELLPQANLLKRSHPVDMKKVAAIILSGGEGKRLYPLTASRCKPALCVGGKFRLIDFPMSNAIHSECRKIFVLTQFLAASLQKHISTSFRQDRFSNGFIEILSCEQKPTRQMWYQGTADAVRQNLEYFLECPVDYFLILSGDQIYQMDFRPLVLFAQEKDADLVIASLPVDRSLAPRMGVMEINQDFKIVDFVEKPQKNEDLNSLEHNGQYLASMGIYCFKRSVLIDLLTETEGHDFGKDLIPQAIKQGSTYSYIFNGYWEDIGTIESFYEANISLTLPKTPFNPYREEHPIFSHHTELPGPKIFDSVIKNSILGEGSILYAKEISNSVLGPRCVVAEGTTIESSYLMGNEFYTPPVSSASLPEKIGIGKNCHLKKTIIDENVLIGDNVILTNEKGLDHYNGPGVFIRNGIIIVTRGITIPANYIL